MSAIVRKIALRVKGTLTELRTEVSADICDRGVRQNAEIPFEV